MHLSLVRRILCILAAVVTVAALAGEPVQAQDRSTEREIRTLSSLALADGRVVGTSARVVVRVDSSQEEGLRVGFFESDSLTSGTMWRAAGWSAAVTAALYEGKPLAGLRISYDISGYLEGPSAGALMATALIAAFEDAPILDHVSMTGTIHPDGSIGHVGGILPKLEAARSAGITKLLIPAGTRMELGQSNIPVDLVERGRELGVTVVEVAHVSEAYHHLTGQRLPVQVVDDGREFTLPRTVLAAITESTARWDVRCRGSLDSLEQRITKTPPALRPMLRTLADRATALRERARTLSQNGLASSGLMLAHYAATMAHGADNCAGLYQAYAETGFQGMDSALGAQLLPEDLLLEYRNRLATQDITNLGDLAVLSEAYAYYISAYAAHMQTMDDVVDALSDEELLADEERLFAFMESVSLRESLAQNQLLFIDDILALGMGQPGPPLPDETALMAWARAMHQAAGANLDALDELGEQDGGLDDLLDDALDSAPNLDTLTLDSDLGTLDIHLLMARTCHSPFGPQALEGADRNHIPASALGSAVASFSLSSLALARRTETDSFMDPAEAGGLEEKYAPLLDVAFDRLRQVLLLSEAQGYTPILPIFHLRAGMGLLATSRSPGDQLLSLGEFWAGSTFGRVTTILAGESPQIVPEAGQVFHLGLERPAPFVDGSSAIMDCVVSWRVADHALFRAMVADTAFANRRVEEALEASLSAVFSRLTPDEAFSTLDEMEEEVRVQCNVLLKAYGVEATTVDLSLVDMGLPVQ